MKTLAHREQLGAWLNAHGLTGEGAEIGVAYGGYARIVLAQWKGEVYHMIDPWEKQPATEYKETQDSKNFQAWFDECQVLARTDNRVVLWRGYSVATAPKFNDGCLDFVYIDGNHSKEAVLTDLDAWYSKVKKGGLVGGHDYYDDINPPHWCEVKSAVTEWAQKHNYQPHLTPCSSWWFIK